MAIGILDRKPFRRGGGVEFGIGREQRQRRVSCMGFQGRRELHGIIATQSVPSRQRCRLGDQSGRHLDDAVLASEKSSWKSATAVAASRGVIEPSRHAPAA